ncbi:MAG: ABC transporter permease [Xanthomonadales bacterium]|nr:ABC transporter permease [Xanthomonadales bacterium]MCB1633244.1 ABC transporter permease [Xanthomonadales bacterium]MCB1640241.1 ABC transporter permease [Xanthomonadales bacterium]
MTPTWIVALKEIRENLRDRRTMLSTLVFGPLFGPVFFAVLIGFATKLELDRQEKAIELPVIGAEQAPALIGWLRGQGIDPVDPPADAQAAVRGREVDLVLRIEADYGSALSEGRPAPLTLIFDQSQTKARATVARVHAALDAYGGLIARQRLLIRGLDPALIGPVELRNEDLSTAQSRSAMVLSMLPYLLILTVFTGGMYLAIDTTAGERERQSLEPLLINPVSRGSLMAGKFLASAAFAMVSLALGLTAFSVFSAFIPADRIGVQINLGLQQCLALFAITAPLALLAAAVQTGVAAFSKSYREAQTYVTLLVFVPAIPSIVLALNPIKPEEWMYAVPLLSHQLLIDHLVRGESVPLTQPLMSIAATLAVAALAALWTTRLYHRESLAVSG